MSRPTSPRSPPRPRLRRLRLKRKANRHSRRLSHHRRPKRHPGRIPRKRGLQPPPGPPPSAPLQAGEPGAPPQPPPMGRPTPLLPKSPSRWRRRASGFTRHNTAGFGCPTDRRPRMWGSIRTCIFTPLRTVGGGRRLPGAWGPLIMGRGGGVLGGALNTLRAAGAGPLLRPAHRRGGGSRGAGCLRPRGSGRAAWLRRWRGSALPRRTPNGGQLRYRFAHRRRGGGGHAGGGGGHHR